MKKAKLSIMFGLIFVLIFGLSFIGCKEPAAEEAAATEEAPAGDVELPVIVGYSIQNMANEFNITKEEGARAAWEEIGEENLTLLITDGMGKAENQIAQVENFITQGAKVVMVQAFDKEGVQPVSDICKDAGIPLIIVNSIISDMSDTDAYVGSNDKDSGIMLMEYLGEAMGGEGPIVMLEGPMGHSAQIGRKEGITEVIAEQYPDIEIVAQQTANWSREEGLAVTENWIQSGLEFKAVAAQNDEMGLGAVVALEAAGMLDDVMVIGIDAIPDAVQAVKDGKFICTVFQDAYMQGYTAVKVGYSRALGNPHTEPGGPIGPNAEYIIPFKYVTPENVDEWLD